MSVVCRIRPATTDQDSQIGDPLKRALPELRPPQLAQQMSQAIDLRERMVAFGERSIPLGTRRHQQCTQGFNVRWKLRAFSLTPVLNQIRPQL
jgi:hypothetical protein